MDFSIGGALDDGFRLMTYVVFESFGAICSAKGTNRKSGLSGSIKVFKQAETFPEVFHLKFLILKLKVWNLNLFWELT